jgi:hypothetical protein
VLRLGGVITIEATTADLCRPGERGHGGGLTGDTGCDDGGLAAVELRVAMVSATSSSHPRSSTAVGASS